jgi:hypothetical protein
MPRLKRQHEEDETEELPRLANEVDRAFRQKEQAGFYGG